MTGRAMGSLREAIHKTATGSGMPMKQLAAELDWSPSELSHRTTLGGESLKPFPADDDHLIRIQRVTGDVSILFTMCELLGYDPPRLKDRDIPKMVAEARATVTDAVKKLQQLTFELDGAGKGRAR